MPAFKTIHEWERPDPAYLLMSLSSLDRPQPFVHSFPRSGLGTCILTGDPEVCEVATEAQAKAYATDNLIAIPYSIAARLYDLNLMVMSQRGEIADYQSIIKNAALPYGDKGVKLILNMEEAEPHEGGGTVAFFELEEGYLVIHESEADG